MTDIDYFEGQETSSPEPVRLETLVMLGKRARKLEDAIDEANANLSSLIEELNNIRRKRLPDAMQEIGIEEFKLPDGYKIEIKDVINASITADTKVAAFFWLAENNCDGIIKTKVSAEFGKGEIEEARRAVTTLEGAGYAPILDQNVHPQTLRAFVKEQIEKGVSIPLDTFNVFEYKEAKITAPPKPRAPRGSRSK